VSVAYTNTDLMGAEVGDFYDRLRVEATECNPELLHGPYRLAGRVSGAVVPPDFSAVITLPFVSGPTGSKPIFSLSADRAMVQLATSFRVRRRRCKGEEVRDHPHIADESGKLLAPVARDRMAALSPPEKSADHCSTHASCSRTAGEVFRVTFCGLDA